METHHVRTRWMYHKDVGEEIPYSVVDELCTEIDQLKEETAEAVKRADRAEKNQKEIERQFIELTSNAGETHAH